MSQIHATLMFLIHAVPGSQVHATHALYMLLDTCCSYVLWSMQLPGCILKHMVLHTVLSGTLDGDFLGPLSALRVPAAPMSRTLTLLVIFAPLLRCQAHGAPMTTGLASRSVGYIHTSL